MMIADAVIWRLLRANECFDVQMPTELDLYEVAPL